ncbi:MAG: hypothetical protein FJY85_23525 [Deltaproteobacteria bacterium]|nr:hypothetical protein [Deltaproteobacteria bacterium]
MSPVIVQRDILQVRIAGRSLVGENDVRDFLVLRTACREAQAGNDTICTVRDTSQSTQKVDTDGPHAVGSGADLRLQRRKHCYVDKSARGDDRIAINEGNPVLRSDFCGRSDVSQYREFYRFTCRHRECLEPQGDLSPAIRDRNARDANAVHLRIDCCDVCRQTGTGTLQEDLLDRSVRRTIGAHVKSKYRYTLGSARK